MSFQDEINKAIQARRAAIGDHFSKGRKGSGAPIGTVKQMGGRDYIKTATGWKYHPKNINNPSQQPATSTPFNKKEHISSLVSEMTKDKRLRGFSHEDIKSAASRLGIDVSNLSDHNVQVIKLSAIKSANPSSQQTYDSGKMGKQWSEAALKEVYSDTPNSTPSSQANGPKTRAEFDHLHSELLSQFENLGIKVDPIWWLKNGNVTMKKDGTTKLSFSLRDEDTAKQDAKKMKEIISAKYPNVKFGQSNMFDSYRPEYRFSVTFLAQDN